MMQAVVKVSVVNMLVIGSLIASMGYSQKERQPAERPKGRVSRHSEYRDIVDKMASVLSKNDTIARESLRILFRMLPSQTSTDKSVQSEVDQYYAQTYGTSLVGDLGIDFKEAFVVTTSAYKKMQTCYERVIRCYREYQQALAPESSKNIATIVSQLASEWQAYLGAIDHLNQVMNTYGEETRYTPDVFLRNQITAIIA